MSCFRLMMILNAQGNFNFLIRAPRLNPGTYYIQVSSYRSDSTGDYVLHVDSTDDHSNTRVSATKIELDTPVSGTINTESDVDYFSIEIDTPTIVLIFYNSRHSEYERQTTR